MWPMTCWRRSTGSWSKKLKSELTRIIEGFPKARLLVLGDFLLDEYIFGEISRVSREAPVLILSYQESHSLAGGGANTVANIQALGARAIPLGYVGDDPDADRLFKAWPPELERRFVYCNSRLRTTRKSRLLAGSFHSFRQQVVRLDYEYPFRLTPEEEERVIAALEKVLPEVDVLLISDYSLGNVTGPIRRKAIELARRLERPVLVDSRDDPGGYTGATSITPNISEVEEFLSLKIGANMDLLEKTGRELLRQWKLDALLITRGRLGMSLFEVQRITHIPIYGSDDVVDVTGAGDTVVAVYATALAAGASFSQAARLSNMAGGIVVTKKGTATVSQQELLEAAAHGELESDGC